jgi:hypothetical protein
MQQQYQVVGEIRLSTISERGPELTINVLKQQWKKKTTRVLLDEVLETIFSLLLLALGKSANRKNVDKQSLLDTISWN